MRDMVFISHANPEDNEFSRWLALRLAQEGYPVWCDLTKLLGGEDFWEDAEQAIRERTSKFLFVLSKSSNHKEGPLNELHIAKNTARDNGLKDFIIPLHIDDLPYRDANISVARTVAVPFEDGWAKGSAQLLKKLAKDGVPTKPTFNPSAVYEWWHRYGYEVTPLVDEPEAYLSDWFPVASGLPKDIYLHPKARARQSPDGTLSYPTEPYQGYLVSFAKPSDFAQPGPGLFKKQRRSLRFGTTEFLSGKALKPPIESRTARNIVKSLLNLAWLRMLSEHGLTTHGMANDVVCFYFAKGLLDSEDQRLPVARPDGSTSGRQVIGYKTLASGRRYWHFGIHVRPRLEPLVFAVRSHVLFTDSQGSLLGDDAMHRARRSQCKDWWNDDWRDRILATMQWLAGAQECIQLPVGSSVSIEVATQPVMFSSPVTFADPKKLERLESDEDKDEDVSDGANDEEG